MPLLDDFHTHMMDELIKNSLTLRKGMPGYELFNKAQKIMNIPGFGFVQEVYNDKPYLLSTQNQNYLGKTLPEHATSACVILSPGDTLFELVARDVKNIVAVDTNELQELVYKLRLASMLTLSHKDYCNFLVYTDNFRFMSEDVFKVVKEGFSKEDTKFLNVWENLFKINSRYEFEHQFFKNVGGNPKKVIQSLPYLRSKQNYYETKDKIEKVNIEIKIMSMIDYLLNNPSQTFDYIDITNILLFIYQFECGHNEEAFKTKILELRKIFEQNLNSNGVLVLDYLFGVDFEDLTEEKIQNAEFPLVNRIYQKSYELLNEHFDIESFQIDKQINGFGDKQDRVLLSRKK